MLHSQIRSTTCISCLSSFGLLIVDNVRTSISWDPRNSCKDVDPFQRCFCYLNCLQKVRKKSVAWHEIGPFQRCFCNFDCLLRVKKRSVAWHEIDPFQRCFCYFDCLQRVKKRSVAWHESYGTLIQKWPSMRKKNAWRSGERGLVVGGDSYSYCYGWTIMVCYSLVYLSKLQVCRLSHQSYKGRLLGCGLLSFSVLEQASQAPAFINVKLPMHICFLFIFLPCFPMFSFSFPVIMV